MGPFCSLMDLNPYGTLWLPMTPYASYGSFLITMAPYGSLLLSMALYALYGFLQLSMAPLKNE